MEYIGEMERKANKRHNCICGTIQKGQTYTRLMFKDADGPQTVKVCKWCSNAEEAAREDIETYDDTEEYESTIFEVIEQEWKQERMEAKADAEEEERKLGRYFNGSEYDG